MKYAEEVHKEILSKAKEAPENKTNTPPRNKPAPLSKKHHPEKVQEKETIPTQPLEEKEKGPALDHFHKKIELLIDRMERLDTSTTTLSSGKKSSGQLDLSTTKKLPSPQCVERKPIKVSDLDLSADVLPTDKKVTWESFNLKKEILMGLENKGFKWPSPVQAAAIPHSLGGQDIVARAKNGTGKAGAFIIPLLNKINRFRPQIQALILVPTRELVLQTVKVCKEIGLHLRLKMLPLYGGVSPKDDIIRLKEGGTHIIVGTPGRVLDFIEQKIISLKHCKYLICDEADKLLGTGFKEVLYSITEKLPPQRQIEMFSATFPCMVQDYVGKYMDDPVKINLMSELTLRGVKQYYAYVKKTDKLHCLKTLLSNLDVNQCFIFCNAITTVERLAKRIADLGFTTYFIHSKMKQEDRNMVFHNFSTKGQCKILVATDLVTRGIDVPSVNVVINFDLPRSTESYLHRIGRSGRFGTKGVAINMVTPEDAEKLREIEEELDVELIPFSQVLHPTAALPNP
ncbi:ATP-dependent RNA helicase DDX6/DHH1 [Nematocida displodere]|uniref:ATP-dependent RNA helicase DDX6/DHH1 n=1 Tax=Nematocida displodere TaxID=1805483 RepID=A0A177EH07_9MICR|nr:ATP-dependent RNA helicase DDX6/DHH1 [Nematocida displodere]